MCHMSHHRLLWLVPLLSAASAGPGAGMGAVPSRFSPPVVPPYEAHVVSSANVCNRGVQGDCMARGEATNKNHADHAFPVVIDSFLMSPEGTSQLSDETVIVVVGYRLTTLIGLRFTCRFPGKNGSTVAATEGCVYPVGCETAIPKVVLRDTLSRVLLCPLPALLANDLGASDGSVSFEIAKSILGGDALAPLVLKTKASVVPRPRVADVAASGAPTVTVAIATMLMNEPPEFIVEWIEWHRMLGVGRFYFYLNGSNNRTRAIIELYRKAGIATVVEWRVSIGGKDNK